MKYISFRYNIYHTHCSVCLADCFQKTFFLKECGHSFCMKCVSVYFDSIKKDIESTCPSCIRISIPPIVLVLKEEGVHRLPHELPQGHTREVSPLP